MNFSKSRVLSTLLLCALAVAFSGVAEAQVCFTRAAHSHELRAEGLTEVVGEVQLVCREATAADADDPFAAAAVPHKLSIALEMSSNITNEIDDERDVTMAGPTDMADDDYIAPYADPGVRVVVRQLGTDNVFDATAAVVTAGLGMGKLSADGSTITWSIYTTADDPDTTETETRDTTAWTQGANGFSAVFSMVRVNAYAVGDGEDVMANVMVGGRQVNTSPLKVADVTTGLMTPGVAKAGDQCMDGSIANARITVKEGFASSFKNGDGFVVNFSGVPEGVSITMPANIPVMENDESTSIKEDEETFRLVLEETNPRTSGVDKDNMVILSNAGSGSVRYNIVMTRRNATAADQTAGTIAVDGSPVDDVDDADGTIDMVDVDDLMDDGALEWQHIYPTFKWDKNDVDLGMVMISAHFHPVSAETGDTFKLGGAMLPRFMNASEDMTIITVRDCMSELFYPFVTSSSGYDTGIVVSNTSAEAGSCSATFSGMGAPEDSIDLGEIMPGMQSVFLVSSHVTDFSGYLTVNCDTTTASGFAHVVDSSGFTGSQGYIAQ